MINVRSSVPTLLVVLAALLACKKESGNIGAECSADGDCLNGLSCQTGKCQVKPTAEATPTPEAPSEPAAPATPEAVEATPVAKSEKDVPEIPEGRSNPPTVAEWSAAPITNTQGTGSWAPDCTSKIVREWLQVNCTGKILGYEKMENFGKEQVDYFQSIKPNNIASFVVRLKKGKTMSVRICREKDRASLFMNWPAAKDRPVHVALGKGPPCGT
ncbi:MAG: hypothetical protein KF718_14875 [Polyangiaceae bacterium]|nr:hypothetical protein [Polyangiaceae bacterium]